MTRRQGRGVDITLLAMSSVGPRKEKYAEPMSDPAVVKMRARISLASTSAKPHSLNMSAMRGSSQGSWMTICRSTESNQHD